jgi:hypothetical protein
LLNKIKGKKMKKIYFALLLTIFLGFVAGNKASGQSGCEVCAGYSEYQYCYILDFQLPGCSTPSHAVFCFDASDCPNGITIQVVELDSDPACEDASWDYVHQWVKDSVQTLCGYKPCAFPPPARIYYSVPICGKVTWLGTVGPNGRVRYRAYPGNCDKRCTFVYDICYDYEHNQQIRNLVTHYITGSGNCNAIGYGSQSLIDEWPNLHLALDPNYKYEIGKIWELDCVQVLSVHCP